MNQAAPTSTNLHSLIAASATAFSKRYEHEDTDLLSMAADAMEHSQAWRQRELEQQEMLSHATSMEEKLALIRFSNAEAWVIGNQPAALTVIPGGRKVLSFPKGGIA